MTLPRQSETQRARIAPYLLNGETAEELRIVPEQKGWATQTYMLSLDFGWGERTIASDMYDHDARAIAYALAGVLDCPVVEVEK